MLTACILMNEDNVSGRKLVYKTLKKKRATYYDRYCNNKVYLTFKVKEADVPKILNVKKKAGIISLMLE